jgi:eukaryotic-like serine/threonine-protein kinase
MGAHETKDSDTVTIDTDAATMVSGDSGERTRNRSARTTTMTETEAETAPTEVRSGPVPVDVRLRPLEELGFGERYRDRRRLGEGGMGEVRLCADLRVGRDVAVKVIHAGRDTSSDMQARFVREARIQGQLEHPSIVPVYDLGVRPDGAAFFTMKRVRGLTLEEIVEGLRAGDSTITAAYGKRRLLSAFSQVCLAVAFAHARGVVHRDLKPANVILGEFGEVYVLDWGVAKLVGVPDVESESASDEAESDAPVRDETLGVQTAAGSILGTLGYMAPEQLRGDTELVGPCSDIYALGTMLFELVTLEPLHPRTSPNATVTSTLQGADARLSTRDTPWGSVPELDGISVRATTMDPEQRFESARQMHESIERFLDGDRDLEKRRELAREHMRAAEESLRKAKEDPSQETAERTRAVRELNSALALDPSDRSALRSMIEVLLESSDHLPKEAEEELEASRRGMRSRSARAAAMGFLACFCLDPLLAWMGIRSWTALVVMGIPLVTIVAYAFYLSRRPLHSAWAYALLGFLAASVAASTVPLFGPFVLVPSIMVACMLPIAVSTRADRSKRSLLLVFGAVGLVVPFALQFLGVLPASYAFSGGVITIQPWAVNFPGSSVALLLLAEALAVLIVPMLVIGRSIDALVSAERRVFAQAWTLRQLMPDEARGAAVAGLADPDDGDDDELCVLSDARKDCSFRR